jgi:hypothetical protein
MEHRAMIIPAIAAIAAIIAIIYAEFKRRMENEKDR